jgi:hypothetical protein
MLPFQLFQNGSFIFKDGAFYQTTSPSSDLPVTYTYELRSFVTGETVIANDVPWLAILLNANSFTDSDSYYANNCVDETEPSNTGGEPLSTVKKTVLHSPNNKVVPMQDEQNLLNPDIDPAIVKQTQTDILKTQSNKKRSDSSFDIYWPTVYDENGAFYNLDGVHGVWSLSTFNPANSTIEGLSAWIGTVSAGLKSLEQIGIRKLIIDVTGNYGGIICFAHSFLDVSG